MDVSPSLSLQLNHSVNVTEW